MYEFSADAYVLRYGWLAAARAASYSVMAVVLVIQARTFHDDFGIGFFLILALWLAGYAVVELRRAVSRAVVFAVDQAGISFGTNGVQELVPWEQISSVELFVESARRYAIAGRLYRCVGVRSPGSQQVSRAGNGPAGADLPDWARQYYLDTRRPDLIPGVDGTIRYAYRRITGWQINRKQLAAAVCRFAPAVPVINGLNYPPPFMADAARRARRLGTGGRRWRRAGAL